MQPTLSILPVGAMRQLRLNFNVLKRVDFMFDRTEDIRKLKILTIVDDFTKRSPGLLVDRSITGTDLVHFFSS